MKHLCTAVALAAFGLAVGPQSVLAQDKGAAPVKSIGQVSQTGPVPSLFVLNADGATLADGKLTLTGVSPNSIVFADRPFRSAGHLETKQFIDTWSQGEDNFGIDPPNATISLLDGSNVADAVVMISDPEMKDDTLTFTAVVLEGSLDGAKGAAALFIDDRGGGGGGGGGARGGGGGGDHFSNYSQVQDPHAAYYKSNDSVGSNDTFNRNVNVNGDGYHGYGGYGYPVGAGAVGFATGAAIGAAADSWGGGYAAPACGYPPYPPCY